MSPFAKKLLDRVASWPDEDVAELEEIAREIEARRTGTYTLSEDEWTDLQEGIAQADRREFVADDVIAEAAYEDTLDAACFCGARADILVSRSAQSAGSPQDRRPYQAARH